MHCWTNVTPKAEWIHRKFSEGLFEHSHRDHFKFRSFGFRPPLPDDNQPKRLKDGSYSMWNIPIEGYIFYNQFGTDGGNAPGDASTFSADGGLGYGKTPDGNYWLAVVTYLTSANKLTK